MLFAVRRLTEVPSGEPPGNLSPILMDWTKVIAQGLHPSQTSPKGLELVELQLRLPQPGTLRKELQQIGMTGDGGPSKVRVLHADRAHIAVLIRTSKGEVVEVSEVGGGGGTARL